MTNKNDSLLNVCSFQSINSKNKCGCSSMVEFRPSKPAVRVRSPSPAPFKLNKDYVVIIAKRIHLFPYRKCGCSSMVEFRPSKPAVRVRSPSPAPFKLNKDYVVIIAKRIHLFPYRTQKLSSLALMVLGGQLPGRVRRSHVIFFPLI